MVSATPDETSPRPKGARAVVLVLAIATAATTTGCGPTVYTCSSDTACVFAGQHGVCEPTGFCALPDLQCSTGYRYHTSAGDGLAGQCAGGVCSPGGWCWVEPVPTGNTLRGLSGSASAGIWAVGDGGTLVHWDGTQWDGIAGWSTDGGLSASFNGVWSLDSSHVWAVGTGGFIVFGDGSGKWTSMTTGTMQNLNGISGKTASDVWAVGDAGTLLHWDGMSWTSFPSGVTTALRAVFAASADEAWAVGDGGTILHDVKGTWSTVSLPACVSPASNLYGVGGSATTDLWIVGDADTALHWNGSSLSEGTVQNATSCGTLRSVSSDAGVTWVAGNAANGQGVIYRAMGSSLTQAQAPSDAPVFRAILPTAAQDVWAVGDDGTTVRWQGGGGGFTASPNPPLTDNLNGAWADGPSDIWVVGDRGTALHFDGSGWAALPSGSANLLGVWGAAADDVWACGSGGAILHWNGSAWSTATSMSSSDLYAIWGSGPGDVWAVGNGGTILHYDGSGWMPSVSPTPTRLLTVWGANANDLWAGGGDYCGGGSLTSVILRRLNGQPWAIADQPANEPVNGLWGASDGDVWATGNQKAFHWDGTTWNRVDVLGAGFFNAVGGIDGTNAWMVTSGGGTWHWDGVTWTQSASGVSPAMSLSAVVGVANGFLAVGSTGSILRHAP